ncbi:protein FLX-like 1 isoform X2 [Abrus precatorius]|uniref:Protein FLX-like 1 isoform X2 n=1 Tax=Abrus precatorius TaxID=3816 RepID=A0A8B8KCS6_ABRPR|nr:protein FLX-like 1 isoform X2 [Abrus precatorius]
MSGRNRGQPHPPPPPHAGLSPPIHDPVFGARALGVVGPMPPHPHPALLEDFRDTQLGLGPRPIPLHPAAIIEERLAAQHQEIQGLLGDNQRLAATHVALKQELEAAQHELQRMAHFRDSLRADTEARMRELYDKSAQLEAELRGTEAARAELLQVHAEVKELTAVRQDLSGQVQAMTQDLARMTGDAKRLPALRADVDAMKQELQCARAAIEYEKKGFAENYEHGQVMEKKLVAMAREMEKLRAEIANAEKRARAAAAAGNPGPGYNANYGNAEAGYAGNPYPAVYGMNPIQPGVENFPQYGPGPGAWGAYDMQRAQGHR